MLQDVRDTDTRCRIVRQAEEFFRLYGYQKTTVADIAKALRMSPANIYRFFDSKKSINEEVALRLMGEVEAAAAAIAHEDAPATDRARGEGRDCGCGAMGGGVVGWGCCGRWVW